MIILFHRRPITLHAAKIVMEATVFAIAHIVGVNGNSIQPYKDEKTRHFYLLSGRDYSLARLLPSPTTVGMLVFKDRGKKWHKKVVGRETAAGSPPPPPPQDGKARQHSRSPSLPSLQRKGGKGVGGRSKKRGGRPGQYQSEASF